MDIQPQLESIQADLDALRESLSQRDRENRRLRRTLLVVAVMGMVGVSLAASSVDRGLLTQRLLLQDNAGKTQAQITVGSDGGIVFADSQGHPRASITWEKNMTNFSLLDEKGEVIQAFPID